MKQVGFAICAGKALKQVLVADTVVLNVRSIVALIVYLTGKEALVYLVARSNYGRKD